MSLERTSAEELDLMGCLRGAVAPLFNIFPLSFKGEGD